jgi:hypothetical protein
MYMIIKNKMHTVNRGVFTQNLKFNYLYKSHYKSYKLLWTFIEYHTM